MDVYVDFEEKQPEDGFLNQSAAINRLHCTVTCHSTIAIHLNNQSTQL